MYSGSGFRDWEIGDVDVFIHEGKYHLFHLIIPNHDYIAHAVSNDGISWKREKNALFVGHPGEWDDDMLWTMHVSPYEDKFRMYYTGLSRKDRGIEQKIGMAESDDLVNWSKCDEKHFPVSSEGPHYEDVENNPRKWLSFRDPFFYHYRGEDYLLVCARSSFGPTSRRGCVALLKWVEDKWETRPPLLYPMVYDDVECPCVFQLNGNSYLIGSIREDIKVRYWFSERFRGEYHNFRSDVLLPQGNYAARVVRDGEHFLLYNFFFKGGSVDELRVLPPPKELASDDQGKLFLRSFYRWNQIAGREFLQNQFPLMQALLLNPTAKCDLDDDKMIIGVRSGYELFTFERFSPCFIWEGTLTIIGMGKLGLVSDMDLEGNGYYYSFDVSNGLVQIRAWGFNEKDPKQNFIFNNIQSNIFKLEDEHILNFRLIRYGNYIELSIDGKVKLTLIDYTYSGERLGWYSASSEVVISNSRFRILPEASSEYASQENEE